MSSLQIKLVQQYVRFLRKVRVANVAVPMVSEDAVSGSRRWPPTKSCISCIRKGVVSDLVAVYSPGRRRKKKARAIMSAYARLA